MNELETDDSFELCDLRVEAVVPPGAKVYCGARDGDYFELKGEMLTLPPGQGVLDLFARGGPAAARRQAAADPPQRLDDDATPRSPAPTRTARAGCASRGPGSGASAAARPPPCRCRRSGRMTPSSRRSSLRPATRFRASSAAAGSSPAATAPIDRDARRRRSHRRFRRRHLHLRLRRHLHRRRGALRRDPRAARRDARRRGGEPPARAHQARARPRHSADASNARDVEAIIDRSLSRLRIERLDLVQFHWWDYAEPRWLEALRLARRSAARRARSATSAAPISTRRMCAQSRGRHSARLDAGAVFASRPPAGERPCRARAARTASGCSATARSPAAFSSDRWLGAPEPAQPLENRSLVKYKLIIDDFGGWTLFQELLARAAPRRRPARQRHRHGREPLRARPARRRRGHRRRAPRARISPPTSPPARSS